MAAMHLKPTFPLFETWLRAQPVFGTVLLVVAGVCLLTVGAKVSVPMWPVPMTLQSLALLLIAAAYGPVLGAAALLGYLALGVAGAPVFALGGGPLYVFGPTGGFLVGFLPALLLVALPLARMPQLASAPLPLAGLMLAATAVIWAVGLAWLARFAPADATALSWAWQKGLQPFLLGGLVKAMLASGLTLALFSR